MVCWRVLRGCNARHFLILLIPLLIAAFLSPLQVVQAAAITVNSLADASVSGNGQCTLREAIANANSNTDSSGGDCGAGSGTDTITFSLNGTITLASTLPNITSVMTIDGTGHTMAISGNNAVQVLHIASGGNLTVNALTIQNGNAGQYYGDRGGGIHNESGTLTVTNSAFTGNVADEGGAIFANLNSVATTITDTTFTTNSAYSGGGAVFAWYSAITLTNVTISGNSAYEGGGIDNWGTVSLTDSTVSGNDSTTIGGGIYNYGSLTITNSSISNNTAATDGGGVYNYSHTMTVSFSTISNNVADNGAGFYTKYGSLTVNDSTVTANSATTSGGGIRNQGGSAYINRSTFSYNTAISGAGIYDGATLRISDSLIFGNSATTIGGGIYDSGTMILTNSTVKDNSATDGAGIWNYNQGQVVNSTISGNSASNTGGGIYAYTYYLIVTNSTVSGNSAPYGAGIYDDMAYITLTNNTFSGNSASVRGGGFYLIAANAYLVGNLFDTGASGINCAVDNGATYDYGYNLSDDGSCGFASSGSAKNISLNLGSLQDNGGPTWTHLPSPGSPVIDRIPHGTFLVNNYPIGSGMQVVYICDQSGQAMDTDQRGQPRPAVAGTACDSGSVEVAITPVPEIVLEAPGPVNIADGGTYNLGTTSVAIPLSRILTVRNTGNAALNLLTNPPTTTGGFIVGNLGSVSLAPGASTTFSLTCPATTAGNPVSGSVSFANDDSDENPFNFTVTCVVTDTPPNAAPPLNYGTSSTVTLSWNMVSGALEYQLQVDDSLAFTPLLTYTVIVPGNTLSIVTPALPDGLYYWRVQAKQPNGTWGGWSEIQSFVIATS